MKKWMARILSPLFFASVCGFACDIHAGETQDCFTASAIRAQAVQQADRLYKRLKTPDAAYGSQELFIAMLAYAEANTNLTRIAEILPFAEKMQDRNPDSKGYGNFRWYSRNQEVLDYNAVDFAMQYGALIWKFHSDKLEPSVQKRMRELLELGLIGLQKHKVRSTYTNIALLNASDLILLAEALHSEAAMKEGEKRLRNFTHIIYAEGVHEFVSPTYYDVDVEALRLLEGACTHEDVRVLARALLNYFWTDIALNWFTPSQRLAGSHSRTYNYVYGFGSLDAVMIANGWMPLPDKYRTPNIRAIYSTWQPSEKLRDMNAVYPRLVEQTWGSDAMCARTHYVCKDITLGTSWRNYSGRMDIALAVDFPAPSRNANQPRVSFIPDGRQDPYGTKKIFDGKVHDKAFHMNHFWVGVQDKADVLALAMYRPEDFKDTTGTLESHLIMPTAVDSVWVDDTRLASVTTNPVPLQSSVYISHGAAVLGIRIPWSRGHTSTPCTLNLVSDNPALHAMRLTLSHPILPTNQVPAHPAGVAYRLRIGSNITNENDFASFRKAFRQESIAVQATETGIVLRAFNNRLEIHAVAPYTLVGPVETIPPPPRALLALNGTNCGKAILETIPTIKAHADQLTNSRAIAVSREQPTLWEAEHGYFDFAITLAKDESASNGAYLWEAEDAPGEKSNGTGKARYTLDVKEAGKYILAGRFLSPTSDDDSFFLTIVGEDGAKILSNETWAVGVRTKWGWNQFTLSKQPKPEPILLPKGQVTLTLQTREAGTKVDQLSLTPIAR
ncbi:MAG: hypothetical protein WCJ02_01510 [bacterium]